MRCLEFIAYAGQGNTLLTDTKLGETAHMIVAGLNTNE